MFINSVLLLPICYLDINAFLRKSARKISRNNSMYSQQIIHMSNPHLVLFFTSYCIKIMITVGYQYHSLHLISTIYNGKLKNIIYQYLDLLLLLLLFKVPYTLSFESLTLFFLLSKFLTVSSYSENFYNSTSKY
jgi:hypothetical protein